MDSTRTLIVGAGISGLALADSLGDEDYLVVEAESEIGGYCRTVERDGFVWDYSGHFFHFRHPEIERDLVARMDGQRVVRVHRQARIWFGDRLIDFPFQRHIDQLPEADYQACRQGLLEVRENEREGASFADMLQARYGRGIAERFLIPYNEKLYGTDLARLDADAMGRFFPHVKASEILEGRSPSRPDGYNPTFTYPERGAVQYVRALARDIPEARIALDERVLRIDREHKLAETTQRTLRYDRLVSSAPLPALLSMCGIEHDRATFGHNKVWVINLGFDRKGLRGVHWVYYPQRELSFYRVGFYDNILGTDRMSLYVEVGLPMDATLTDADRRAMKDRALEDLRRCGVWNDQTLVASHDVLLDPAYVHISRASDAAAAAHRAALAANDVYSIGRYGAWTYCSIEDNIVEARALAGQLRDGKTR